MDPNYRGVQAKLVECNKQLRLKELCAQEEASVRDKNWPKVVEVLEKLHELVPEDVSIITRLGEAKRQLELDRLYRKAMEYIQKKRWRKAKVALEKVVLSDSNYRDGEATAKLEIVKERSSRSSPIIEALRDPLWQGIGGVVGIVALIITAIALVWQPSPNAARLTPTPKSAIPCNGDFGDNLECWEHGGELDQDVRCEGDQCYAILGNPRYKCEGGVPVGEAWIKQSFQVPETVSHTLSLRYWVFSYDLYDQDFFQVKINGETVDQLGNMKWSESSCTSDRAWESGWQYREFDLSPYKGQIVALSFHNVNGAIRNVDGAKWWNTWTYVDNVEIH